MVTFTEVILNGKLSFFCAVVSLAALNSFRNLKSETHLLNDQVSEASSVKNGLAKTCLVADMLRNNLSRIFYHWLQVALLRFGVSARLVRFELLPILLQLKYLFSAFMKIYTMIGKVKKQIFSSLVTYINLSGVFHTHSRVSNNQGVIIICFVLKPYLYDASRRPCDCQFYFPISMHVYFILGNHLVSN